MFYMIEILKVQLVQNFDTLFQLKYLKIFETNINSINEILSVPLPIYKMRCMQRLDDKRPCELA